jgi:hypothetical protein
LKISTNSWHFALWKFTHHFTGKKGYQIEEPTSLWRYIWRLIIMTPVTVFIFIVIMLIVICFGGTIIIGRNIYTILTLQGVSWFNFTDSDHRDDPAFKWLWEFKWINQKPRNASWWAKFFWISMILSGIIRWIVFHFDYQYLVPHLWLIAGVQGLTLYLSYFIWQDRVKSVCKKYWSALIPQVHFTDPEDDCGEENGQEGRDWV